MLSRIRVFLQQRFRSNNNARRANAALQRSVFQEFLLQRMQRRGPATPSIVPTFRPSVSTANTRHESTAHHQV